MWRVYADDEFVDTVSAKFSGVAIIMVQYMHMDVMSKATSWNARPVA